jgi:hypothetical protein
MSRRSALRGALLATGAFALAGCGLTVAQTITIAQQDLSDATSIIAALNTILGTTSLAATVASVEAPIAAYLGDAKTALASFAVGSLQPLTSVSGVLADLTNAVNTAAKVLPGNAYISDAQLVLAGLSLAWSIVSVTTGGAAKAIDPAALAAARARLALLPRPVL